MDLEDLEPRKVKPEPKKLDGMSINDLKEYIAELEAEITRVRTAIKGKEAARDGASAFFKK
jgi:uncharacterized small protein (DUF1192 family)